MSGLLLAAGGCTSDGGHDGKRDDPLLGAGARPGNSSLASASPSPVGGLQPPAPPAYKPQPPLTAATPTSNASLAGGVQPLTSGNELRMGAPAAPAFAPVQPVAGVTPVPPPGSPAPPPVAAAGGSLDQAYAAVTARAPLSYRMTFNSQTGEYTFQMTVPSKLNTAAVQHVEASSANPADAIRRTLEQLN